MCLKQTNWFCFLLLMCMCQCVYVYKTPAVHTHTCEDVLHIWRDTLPGTCVCTHPHAMQAYNSDTHPADLGGGAWGSVAVIILFITI